MTSRTESLNILGGRERVASANAFGAGSIALRNANLHRLTLTGALTSLAITDALPGVVCSVTVELIQDAEGGRAVTLGPAFKFAGGTAPAWSTAAGARDILSAYSTDGGATWMAFASLNMS